MFDALDNINPSILVAFGVGPGVVCRIQIFNKLSFNYKSNTRGVFVVNTISIFLISLFILKKLF